jgi:NADH-quinone oxidoreductase subunit M
VHVIPWLTILVFLPLAGAILVAILPARREQAVRNVSLITTILTLVVAAIVVGQFQPGTADFQMDEANNWSWIAPLGVRFHLGVDGISLWLVALTALLMPTAVLCSWTSISHRIKEHYALMLVLETGMLGVFLAMDFFVFYLFFEFTLIPMFLIIGIWGGHSRARAARKFFIFTLAGSVLTFLGILYLVLSYYWQPDVSQLTWSIVEVSKVSLPCDVQIVLFLALLAGFAIKVPLFPFTTWLPLAHTEAPTAGSVLLAGVLLKMGTYGFLRFCVPVLPEATIAMIPWISLLSIIGIIYGALVVLAQPDIKKLVAYSSVSHLGFCMLGMFACTAEGLSGSVMQMVNHGLTTGALFAIVGMLYERYHTRDIAAYSGMAHKLPVLTFFLVLMTLGSIGLPGLNGFVGEFLVLVGTFKSTFVGSGKAYAIVAATGIILGALYMLYLLQRVFFGPEREPERHGDHGPVKDLSQREWGALLPLALFVILIGVYPKPFLTRMEPSIQKIVAIVEKARDQAKKPEQSRRARRTPVPDAKPVALVRSTLAPEPARNTKE